MKPCKFLLVLLLCAACSKETPPVKTSDKTEPGEIVVVATNDFHAALDRAEGLASVIDDLRKRYGERMVYLDAGDQFQGSLEGNISKGKAVVGFFNLLRLDAAAIGNHEFDYGPDVSGRITVEKGEDGMGAFKKRAREANYAFLSANLILDPPVSCQPGSGCNALGQKTVFEPRVILQRASKKIGVIGATTLTARYRTSPAYLAGANFGEMLPVVQAESKFLREAEKCDWVLLTVHAGLSYKEDGKTLTDTELLSMLRKMQEPVVDAVVAGDVHTSVTELVRGIPVLQAGSGGKKVGVLHLNRSAGKTQYRFDPLVEVPDTGVSFKVTEFMKLYRQRALERKRQTVATATAPFPLDSTQETALGNLVATAVLEAGKKRGGADVALINAGAMRTGLPAGTITYSHVFKLLPFDDYLVVAELTGSQLRTLLEIAFSDTKRMPAVAGLHITRIEASPALSRDLNGDGVKEDWERNLLIDVRDQNGNPINEQKVYRLATLSYLVEGGDYQNFIYDRISTSKIHWFGEILVREIIADYMTKKSRLNPSDYYSKSTPTVLTAESKR